MTEALDDPNCRIIERAQQHMRARMGDVILKEDVWKAEKELGLKLEVKQK